MTNRKLNLSKVFRKLKFGKDLDLRVSPPLGVGGCQPKLVYLSLHHRKFSLLKPYGLILVLTKKLYHQQQLYSMAYSEHAMVNTGKATKVIYKGTCMSREPFLFRCVAKQGGGSRNTNLPVLTQLQMFEKA